MGLDYKTYVASLVARANKAQTVAEGYTQERIDELCAAIAYAGTVALGEAMHRYYALGERPTRYVLSALYRQSIAEAREVASGMLRRLRSTRKPRKLLRGKESADGA